MKRSGAKSINVPGSARGFFLGTAIVPKVGPFKALDFKVPTPKTENMYFASINLTVDNYGSCLKAVARQHVQAN